MSSKLNRDDVLDLLRQHKPMLKELFGITEVALYGSFARDEGTKDSDIDVSTTPTSRRRLRHDHGCG